MGQAYDGASNMSGKRSGCAQYISQLNPRAVYVHCKSHILNLALVKACTSVSEISKYDITLYCILKTSKFVACIFIVFCRYNILLFMRML